MNAAALQAKIAAMRERLAAKFATLESRLMRQMEEQIDDNDKPEDDETD